MYLDWPKVMLMLGTIIGLQFITRIKAVADGMMFRQIMIDNEIDANEIIKMMKKESDKARQDKNYN
jgi:pimeloyl-CoA synthetase